MSDFDFSEQLDEIFGVKPAKKRGVEPVGGLAPSPARVAIASPAPAQESSSWLGDIGRGIAGGYNSMIETLGKGIYDMVPERAVDIALKPIDLLTATGAAARAGAFKAADVYDEGPILDTVKAAAIRGTGAFSKVMEGEGFDEPGFAESVNARAEAAQNPNERMGTVQGLLADIAFDPSNVVDPFVGAGKVAKLAGVMAIPAMAKKVVTAVDDVADVAADTTKAVEPVRYGRPMPAGRDVYHGSPSLKGRVMSLDQADSDALFGPGLYFTEEAMPIAEGYAGRKRVPARADTIDTREDATKLFELPSGRRAYIKEGDIQPMVGDGRKYRDVKFVDEKTGEEFIERFDVEIDTAGRPAFPEKQPKAIEYPSGATVTKARVDIKNAFDIDDYNIKETEALLRAAGKKFFRYDDGPELDSWVERLQTAVEMRGDGASNENLYRELENLATNFSDQSRLDADRLMKSSPEVARAYEMLDDYSVANALDGKHLSRNDVLRVLHESGLSRQEAVRHVDDVMMIRQAHHGASAPKKLVNELLLEQGYDGITHVGGRRTNNEPHQVWIALKEGIAKTPWGSEVGNINPSLLANVGLTAGGAMAGAAANADSEYAPGGMLTGALAGAAGGRMIAKAGIGLARAASKTADVAGAVGQTAAQAAAQVDEAAPVLRQMDYIPKRPEALGVAAPAAKSDNVVRAAADSARTQQWLAKHVGITDAGDRAIVTKALQNGDDYLAYKQRRFSTHTDPNTGVVTARSRSWAQDTAESFRMVWDPVKVTKGTALNAAQMESLERQVRGLSEKMIDITKDFDQASKLVSAGQDATPILEKWGVSSLDALDVLTKQSADEALIGWKSAMGVRSELGRSLNSLKKKIAYAGQTVNRDENFIKRMNELNVDATEMRDALLKHSTDDQRYRFLRDMSRASNADMFRWYYISSLLSGPKTHARNVISNTLNALGMNAAHAAGRGVEVFKGNLSVADWSDEMRAMREGQRVGFVQGYKDAMDVWRKGFSADDAAAFAEKPPEIRMSDILGTQKFDSEATTRWLNSVSRFLDASDTFSRTVMYSGALHAGAYAEASKMLKAGKIKQADFIPTVEKMLADPTILAPKVHEQAVKVAKDAVYRQDPGDLMAKIVGVQRGVDEFMGEWITNKGVNKIKNATLRKAAAVATAPIANLGTLVAPFVKTPANVLKKQLRAMGGGFASGIQHQQNGDEILAAIHRGEAMLGIAGMAGLGTYALASDRPVITGIGPADPIAQDDPLGKGMDLFYASNRPSSFRLPGTDTWIDYRSLGPAAGPLSLVGNVSDAVRRGGRGLDGAALVDAAVSFGRGMFNNSFLTGIQSVMAAIEDRSGVASRRTVGRIAAGLVPASGTLRTARQSVDPVIRDTRDKTLTGSIVHNVANIVPGASTFVPARVDYAGNVLRTPGTAVERMVSPFERASVPVDQTREDLADLGAENYLTRPTASLKDDLGNPMELSGIQSTELKRGVGVAQYEVAKSLLAIPGFRDLPAEMRGEMIREAMSDAREQAKSDYRNYLQSVSTAKP